MQRLHSIDELGRVQGPLHLALGVFDGVHIGHRAVIGAAVAGARESGGVAGVLTFEPHPIQVLAPDRAPRRILASLEHKERLLAELGVEIFLVLPFTEELAKKEAGEFAEDLLGSSCVRQVTAGEDWKFGRGRVGSVAMLEEIGRAHGVVTTPVAPVMLAGERVSSTRVRQALRDGNLPGAAAMLGRPYTVLGEVVKGDQLGRKLGVPTANIDVANEQLPPDGVHVVEALAADEWRPGVGNLGVRPTVDGTRRFLEVHLFDFDGDLYGEHVEVRFGKRLRGEEKFAGIEELKEQLVADVAEGRALFTSGTAMDV